MDRMQPVVLHPKKPFRKPTEEEMKDFDERWDRIYEGKTVCITDPSKSGESDGLTEALKDPKRRSAMCIDYSGNLSYKDFYTWLMNGDYTMTDRKDTRS